MTKLIDWWRERVFWWRFTHGKCTLCGKHQAALYRTWCEGCIKKARHG